jgi:hypothetical protein
MVEKKFGVKIRNLENISKKLQVGSLKKREK